MISLPLAWSISKPQSITPVDFAIFQHLFSVRDFPTQLCCWILLVWLLRSSEISSKTRSKYLTETELHLEGRKILALKSFLSFKSLCTLWICLVWQFLQPNWAVFTRCGNEKNLPCQQLMISLAQNFTFLMIRVESTCHLPLVCSPDMRWDLLEHVQSGNQSAQQSVEEGRRSKSTQKVFLGESECSLCSLTFWEW